MKIILVYYSFSGNTNNAMLFLRRLMEEKGHQVRTMRLKLIQEEKSFFRQGRDAFLRRRAHLADCDYNLGGYDFAVFATPVWAFTITPALRSYLNKAEGLKGKRAGFVLTYGAGIGVDKTRRELKLILENKGAKVIFALSLKGEKTKEEDYLRREFSSLNYEL